MADLRNEIAWSWSRHKTLRECPRKYYWQYYGSWGGWSEEADSNARAAYRLKRLTSFDQLVGNAVHKALARALAHRPSDPCELPAAAIAQDAERIFERGCEEYQLADDYYGVPGIPERRTAAESKLAAAVAGVRSSPLARGLFTRPKDRLRWVDYDFLHFDEKKVLVGDEYVLFGSPDVAVADAEGGIHIIEWKTGRRDESHHLQLAAYALFLHLKLAIELRRLSGHVVYLQATGAAQREDAAGLGAQVPAILDMVTELYADVRARLTDVDRNAAGEPGRFPLTEDARLCGRCNFRELCGRADAGRDAAFPAEDGDPDDAAFMQ